MSESDWQDTETREVGSKEETTDTTQVGNNGSHTRTNNTTNTVVDPFRNGIAFRSSSPVPRVAQTFVPAHLRTARSEDTLNSLASRMGTTPGNLPFAHYPPMTPSTQGYLPWAATNVPYTSSSPYEENFYEEQRALENWQQYQTQVAAHLPLGQTVATTEQSNIEQRIHNDPQFLQNLANRIAQRLNLSALNTDQSGLNQQTRNVEGGNNAPQRDPERGNEIPGDNPVEINAPHADNDPTRETQDNLVHQGTPQNPQPGIIGAIGSQRFPLPPLNPLGFRTAFPPAHMPRPLPHGISGASKLEISNPITQHVRHIEALHAVKHDTAASVATTDHIMLQMLNMMSTGRGDPTELAQTLLQKMRFQQEQQLADTTALQLASSNRLKNLYEHKLRLPPLYPVRSADKSLLKSKEILSRISPFDRTKNPSQNFADTWDEVLNYTQGSRFHERDYIEILLVVLRGSARQELIRMTTACYTPLSEILEHMYLVYCNRKTVDDEIAALKSFVRQPSENIKTCMSRATQMVKQLRPHLTAAQGSYSEAERGILQSILFSVVSANTRSAIDLERRQRAKQGVTSSLLDLVQSVDDYESSHNCIPTVETVVQQLYLPTHLAPLVSAHTLASSTPPNITEPSNPLADLSAFVTKITKLEVDKKLKRSKSSDRSSKSFDTSTALKASRKRSVSADPGKSLSSLSSQTSTSSAHIPGNQLEWFSQSSTSTESRKPRSRDSHRSEGSFTSSQGDRKRRRLDRDEDTDMSDVSPSPSYRRTSDKSESRPSSRHRQSRSKERPNRESRRSSSRSPSYQRSSNRDEKSSSKKSVPSDSKRSHSEGRPRSSGHRRSSSESRYDRYDRRDDRSPSPRRSYKREYNSSYKKPYTKGVRNIHTPKTIIRIDDRPYYKCKLQHCMTLHPIDEQKGAKASLN